MNKHKLVIISSYTSIYKDTKGYYTNAENKKYYIEKAPTEAKSIMASKENKSADNFRRVCNSCGRPLKQTEETTCDECWFLEQTKLKGGQYL